MSIVLDGFGTGLDLTSGLGASTLVASFAVVGARCLESNLIRVLLSDEPLHASALGEHDALNRDNWAVVVVEGAADDPGIARVERVGFDAVEGWFVELRTLARVVSPGTVFATVAAATLQTPTGASIAGAPNDRGQHPGIVPARPRIPKRIHATTRGVDLRYDFLTGAWSRGSAGGFDIEHGDQALEKRIIRRAVVAPGAYYHLPRFGTGIQPSKLARATVLAKARGRMLEQVRSEEGVRQVEVSFDALAPGTWRLGVRAKTDFGQIGFGVDLEADPD